MIAWSLLPTRFEDGRHEAIEQGLRANGYDVRHGGPAAIRSDDVLVTWNSHGRAEALSAQGRRFLLDPILEPIHFGFTESLLRYHAVRRRFPQAGVLGGVCRRRPPRR